MQTYGYIWFEYHAAQQRVRETFTQAPAQDEQSHPNSSTVAQPDGQIAGREGESISPEATAKDRRRAAKE
jgi:hypothetical protein